MSDSGDEADSRTASFGAQRARKNTPSSRAPSGDDSRPTKKRRRNRSRTASDLGDFVPKGASFTATSLEVDPDDTSSSGSDSDSASDKSDAQDEPSPVNPHAGSTAPAISWNQGKKTAVRTTLGKRKAGSQVPSPSIPPSQSEPEPEPQPQTNGSTADSTVNGTSAKQFKAVNGTYWRSRSASVSSEDDEVSEEGEVNTGSDSDDSELDSEADDSLMLNIGTKGDGVGDYDPESLLIGNGPANGHSNGNTSDTVQAESKEEAFQRFSQKYPTAPVCLLDLQQDDMDVQAKFVYWDRDVNAIDLQLPVGCIECLRQGHMAEVCPTKECVHCGAWNTHSSTQCPSWRRCQRCRERGHVQGDCPSALKSSAAEVPCDYCGSSTHMESDCDHQYSLPTREPLSQTIAVSISCAHCTSGNHLIGDCPHLPPGLQQTTACFTLKDIDPANITNLNVPAPSRKAPPPPSYQRGKGRRGGGGGSGARTPSSNSEEDMMPRKGVRKGPPPARGRGRGTIKFGSSVGSDQPRNKPPPFSRPKGPPPRGGGGGNRGRGRGRGGKPRGGRP